MGKQVVALAGGEWDWEFPVLPTSPKSDKEFPFQCCAKEECKGPRHRGHCAKPLLLGEITLSNDAETECYGKSLTTEEDCLNLHSLWLEGK